MTGWDFAAQYGFVCLVALGAAYRDHFPMMVNGNVEPIIRQQERADEAFEAKIWLARMKK